MRIIVLGAGIIGTATAWYLNKAGHEVSVIDRQPAPGLETSFANGGQISVSHAEPWANPGAPLQVLRWMFREDAPLLFRLRADLRQWQWCLRFLRECTPARTRINIAHIVNLGLYSRAALREVREEAGLQYAQAQRGILHFYTSGKAFDAAQAPARLMREFGCDLEMKTPAQCVEIEPALQYMQKRLAGGSYSPSDESGDAYLFTRQLAAMCAARRVEFIQDTVIERMIFSGSRIEKIQVRAPDGYRNELGADAFVVTLGSYSPALLRPCGIALNIYPAKGYSLTMPVADHARAYQVSLTDDEHKLVFSRLGDRLRIAGTSELNGYDLQLNRIRCKAIMRRVNELFPGAGDAALASYWTGLRPATPSNVPYVGRSRFSNLYLNTGHGTLGWTHACGSGKALAAIVGGRAPEVDFPFTGTAV